jgi:hypothetical protein
MTHTLAAVFDNRTDAERAQEELIKAGFSSGTILLNDAATAAGATTPTMTTTPSSAASSTSSWDCWAANTATRTCTPKRCTAATSLTVDTDSQDGTERAADIAEDFSPIDIDDHETVWRAGGWSGAETLRSDTGASQTSLGA